MKSWKTWTAAEDELLRKLYLEGYGKRISFQQFNHSRSAIYQRARNLGLVKKDRPLDWTAIRKRFQSRLKRSANGCLEWQGPKDEGGYGKFSVRINGRAFTRRAHQWTWIFAGRELPIWPLTLEHNCKNEGCADLAHLEILTLVDNVMRGDGITAQNKRKTQCKRGHEFTPANTRIDKNGGRRCLKCQKLRNTMYYTRRKNGRKK